MKKERISIKVVLDFRRTKIDLSIPLKLRITFKGTRKYYATGYSASEKEWLMINSTEAKGQLRDIKNQMAKIERDAGKCIDGITIFSFEKFEDAFFEKPIKYQSLKSAFDSYIEKLNLNSQVATATSYQTAYNSLTKFKPNLSFSDVNVDFLNAYEKWLLGKEKSITTVGIYLRPLRAIFNIAKDDGLITADMYPFGKRKYVIPTGKNIKKALDISQIEEIFKYHTQPYSFEDRAKDFWMFTYLCNGINMMDIARLRYNQLDKKTITFEREKTKRTKRNEPVKITASRNSYIDAIITKWGKAKPGGEKSLVFDIIDENDTALQIRKKVHQFLKVTNKWMGRIGSDLGFEFKPTTYVARHSFATILVRNGAPLEFASQSLGHTNLVTTQKYFAGFDLEAQDEYMKALVKFDK